MPRQVIAKVPFLPCSLERARKLSRHVVGIGESLSKFFPNLDFHLDEGRFEMEARNWLGLAFFTAIGYFLLVFFGTFVFTLAANVALNLAIGFALLSGLGVSGLIFMFIVFYPKVLVKRRIKDLEQHIPYALHHMLIQVRAGVPIFNALVSVSNADYGSLSAEMRKAVTEINTGRSVVAALDALSRNNSSLYLRRILWQIANSLKSGSDVGATLKEIVNSISIEQKTSIKKYGAELNPIALFYMMGVVIFPTLGIVFLLVLSSFINIEINLNFVLIGIVMFLFLIQIMFIGIIKNKRPTGV